MALRAYNLHIRMERVLLPYMLGRKGLTGGQRGKKYNKCGSNPHISWEIYQTQLLRQAMLIITQEAIIMQELIQLICLQMQGQVLYLQSQKQIIVILICKFAGIMSTPNFGLELNMGQTDG